MTSYPVIWDYFTNQFKDPDMNQSGFHGMLAKGFESMNVASHWALVCCWGHEGCRRSCGTSEEFGRSTGIAREPDLAMSYEMLWLLGVSSSNGESVWNRKKWSKLMQTFWNMDEPPLKSSYSFISFISSYRFIEKHTLRSHCFPAVAWG